MLYKTVVQNCEILFSLEVGPRYFFSESALQVEHSRWSDTEGFTKVHVPELRTRREKQQTKVEKWRKVAMRCVDFVGVATST